jgi:hypothetical protein
LNRDTQYDANQILFAEWRAQACALVPPPFTDFRLHEFPSFLLEACWKWQKHNREYERGLSRAMNCHSCLRSAIGASLDHFGSAITCTGAACFVTQPYGLSAAMLAGCEDFARSLNLHCHLDAGSQWYPGRTLSVILTVNQFIKPGSPWQP